MEEKAKTAKSYLESVLSALGLEADISEELTEEGIFLDVKGEGMGLLIGKDGSTLSAVEFIINIITNRNSEEYNKVYIDAEGYKEKKKIRLEQMAVEAAETVENEKTSIELEPMSAYERRIIHLTLRENTAVRTESEGEEPQRRIVIKPL